MSWIVRLLIAGALLLASFPARAHGQIYSWREADGTLVLSTTPKEGATKTYAVGTAGSNIRTTRPASSRRAEQFEPLIKAYAAEHNVRADLVRAVIQAESAFNPLARSHKGAMGLMQLMPATAAELGVNDPYDPEQNIRGGLAYLRWLLAYFEGDVALVAAAYNAGEGKVERYRGIPPYLETRAYVRRILDAVGQAQHPYDARVTAPSRALRLISAR